jgi:hypothetical protein
VVARATFAPGGRDSTDQSVELADPRALVYRQMNTDEKKRLRVTKTYVRIPARANVIVDVEFESLSRRPQTSTARAGEVGAGLERQTWDVVVGPRPRHRSRRDEAPRYMLPEQVWLPGRAAERGPCHHTGVRRRQESPGRR